MKDKWTYCLILMNEKRGDLYLDSFVIDLDIDPHDFNEGIIEFLRKKYPTRLKHKISKKIE